MRKTIHQIEPRFEPRNFLPYRDKQGYNRPCNAFSMYGLYWTRSGFFSRKFKGFTYSEAPRLNTSILDNIRRWARYCVAVKSLKTRVDHDLLDNETHRTIITTVEGETWSFASAKLSWFIHRYGWPTGVSTYHYCNGNDGAIAIWKDSHGNCVAGLLSLTDRGKKIKKIELQMIEALNQGQEWHLFNTSITAEGDVYLHGYQIARFYQTIGSTYLELSDCGWPTATAKSRLNAILEWFHSIAMHMNPRLQIFQRNYQWFFSYGATQYRWQADRKHYLEIEVTRLRVFFRTKSLITGETITEARHNLIS